MIVGFNERLDGLQAALLRVKLPYLETWNAQRRHHARDQLAELLRAEGIDVGVHYTPAAHLHAAFAGLPASSRPAELPESEAWAAEELSLPMFPELTDAEVDRVADACRAACTALGAHL